MTNRYPTVRNVPGERGTCAACGHHFAGQGAFDDHRQGDYWPVETRRCVHPSDAGLVAVFGDPPNVPLWRCDPSAATASKREQAPWHHATPKTPIA